MKTCFKCGVEKALAEFYVHKAMADGYLGKCKECTKADERARRFGPKREEILAHYRSRDESPESRARRLLRCAEYKRMNREKCRAHALLKYAVDTGKVVPWPVCAVPECAKRPEGHHYDYSRPLDVIWLCPAHHRQTHALVSGHYSSKEQS
jgi:hypothetical protein